MSIIHAVLDAMSCPIAHQGVVRSWRRYTWRDISDEAYDEVLDGTWPEPMVAQNATSSIDGPSVRAAIDAFAPLGEGR